MRRRQPLPFDHPLALVIVEPILAWLEAGDDRMPRRRRVFRRVLARRTVTASYVPALRTTTEMKPPAIRRLKAFHTPIATRLRGRVDSAPIVLHVRFNLAFDLTSFVSWTAGRGP